MVRCWHNKNPNVLLNVLVLSCVHERNEKRECEWSLILSAVYVKANQRVYGIAGVAMRCRTVGGWAQTRWICSHKSPIIPLLLTAEKQLLSISKRVKMHLWMSKHMCMCVWTAVWRETAHLQCFSVSSFPVPELQNPSFKQGLVYLHVSACFVSLSQTLLRHFDALRTAGWTSLRRWTLTKPGSGMFVVCEWSALSQPPNKTLFNSLLLFKSLLKYVLAYV